MSEAYTLERLFREFPGGICVPRIQRGYVQGRDDDKGSEIRANFVPALVGGAFGGDELSLDFVYGVASGDGGARRRLLPLDGQQRLSTLFLLAWLCGKWKPEWRFDYEARRIPQLFVEGLREHPFGALTEPSTEIRDSAWFLPVWENDPTVAGMIRMLDALHEAIGQRNRAEADFGRITFLLHGIEGQCDTFDHIFRKMNARGKELSPWENLKAILDKHLPKPLAAEWREKIDGEWAELIWSNANGDIAKLDCAMEKIARMSYAQFSGINAQGDSLWLFEGRLCGKVGDDGNKGFSPEIREAFYRTAMRCLDQMETIAANWTDDRAVNSLWDGTGGDEEFWEWLCNGNSATPAQLLRLAFLSESPSVDDAARRKRALLNLLDASTGINGGNFGKALSTGLDFLDANLDLQGVEARQAGYSPNQLQDEERKWPLDETAIVSFEKDELVCKGSLLFIGWSPFRDVSDIRERLGGIRAAIAGDRWLEFYQDLVSRIPPEKFGGRYAYTPLRANDTDVWRDRILNDARFIDALKTCHDVPDIHPEIPAWMNHLADLLRSGKVRNSALRCWNGWMFLLQTDAYRSANSVRMDWNENERNNRQLLRAGQVHYASPWPWAEAKENGVWYNVCDSSWRECNNPPKWMKGSDGSFHLVTSPIKENG